MSEIEHLVVPALRAAGRPTTYENQERMRKELTEAAATQKRNQRTLSEISEKEVEAGIAAYHQAVASPVEPVDIRRRRVVTAILEAAAHARSEAVGIKPLEWEKVTERVSDALGVGILYRIVMGSDGTCNLRIGGAMDGSEYPSLGEAKAAAQADYEQHISAALAHPAVPEGWNRYDLAKGLAMLDGIALHDIKSTVGPADDANHWREYLGRADDLLAHLSAAAAKKEGE